MRRRWRPSSCQRCPAWRRTTRPGCERLLWIASRCVFPPATNEQPALWVGADTDGTMYLVFFLLAAGNFQNMLQPLRVHHQQLAAQEAQEQAKKAAQQPVASPTTASTSSAPKATIGGLEPTSPSPADFRSVHTSDGNGFDDGFDAVDISSTTPASSSHRKLGARLGHTSAASFDGWEDFDDLDDDDADGSKGAMHAAAAGAAASSKGLSSEADGWGDDDDAWGSDNDDGFSPPAKPAQTTAAGATATTTNVSIPKLSAANRVSDPLFDMVAPHGSQAPKTTLNLPVAAAAAPRQTTPTSLSQTAAKPATLTTPTAQSAPSSTDSGLNSRKKLREKAAVKKLSVENDDWDDF